MNYRAEGIRKGETVYPEADKSSRLAAAEKVEGTWDNRVVTQSAVQRGKRVETGSGRAEKGMEEGKGNGRDTGRKK